MTIPRAQHDIFPLMQGGALDVRKLPAFEEFLVHINADRSAERDLAKRALLEVLESESACRDAQLATILTGSMRIANPETIAGFTDAVGEFEGHSLTDDKIALPRTNPDDVVVGCAGSGKKGRKTINISTPSIVVATAGGAKVVKAGSRSASSVTGSTDILEGCGYRLPESTESSTRAYMETGFGFYSIEGTVPKFDSVYGNRFFSPHTLSYVLPATLIPVESDAILYGLAGPNVSLSAKAFKELGYRSALVCSNTLDGLRYIDEMASQGGTSIAGIREGQVGHARTFDAMSVFGISDQTQPSIDSLHDPASHTALFQKLIAGDFPNSVAENTICLNAATILYLGKVVSAPEQGFARAQEIIRSGRAMKQLETIIEVSRSV